MKVNEGRCQCYLAPFNKFAYKKKKEIVKKLSLRKLA